MSVGNEVKRQFLFICSLEGIEYTDNRIVNFVEPGKQEWHISCKIDFRKSGDYGRIKNS